MNTLHRERAQAEFFEQDHDEALAINKKLSSAVSGYAGEVISEAMLTAAIVDTEKELLKDVKPYLRPFGYENAIRAERWSKYRSAFEMDKGTQSDSEEDSADLPLEKFEFDTGFRSGDPYFVNLFAASETTRRLAERHGVTLEDPLLFERKFVIYSLLNAMDDLVNLSGVPINPNNRQEFVRVNAAGVDDNGHIVLGNTIAERLESSRNREYYLDFYQPGLEYGDGSISLTIEEVSGGFTAKSFTGGRDVRLKATTAYRAYSIISRQNRNIEPVFEREPYKPKIR